jgi:hypothetical protein
MSIPAKNQPRALADLFGGNPALSALSQAASLRVTLWEAVREALDEPLREQVLACNLRDDGTLVVTTASPAWAARLRFEAERMLDACRERFPGAVRVRVRISTEP